MFLSYKRGIFLASVLVFILVNANTQQANIDSLQHTVDEYKRDDSIHVKKLLALANAIPNNEMERAEALFNQALELSSKIGWQKGKAITLSQLSVFYSQKKQFDKSISAGLKATDIAAALNDSLLLTSAYSALGDAYRYMGDAKQAEIFLMKAQATARKLKNEGIMLDVYSTLAVNYAQIRQWDKVHLYADSIISLASKLNNNYAKAAIFGLLGGEQFDKKDFAKAKEYYIQYLQAYKKLGLQVMISWSSCLLSHTYSSLKQVDSAFYYAKQSLDICIQNKYDPDAPYEALYDAYNAAHDYKNALKYHLLWDSCVQTSYNFESGKNVADVQAKSEQERKDLIAKLELDKKESEAKRTRDIQYTIIGAVLLLALFFYWNSRQKQKAKAKIEIAYSELKSTQQQLIQSEKMASLGELTAGIAHEIQNPLNFVNNFSEVNTELIDELEQEVDKGHLNEVKAITKDIKENEQKINHHGKRADAIVKGMLQHTRSSSGIKEPTDINALADEYLRLAYHGLRAKDKSFNATLKTDFDNSIGKINIIPQDIGRVMLNLINNAFYAAPLPPEGGFKDPNYKHEPTVWVSTKKVGDKVLISVRDNGPGIPQKVLNKIFQPFFTTKPTGQGTGLGLSLSYDIIKAHGGEISVETKEREGSEFIIQLPIQP